MRAIGFSSHKRKLAAALAREFDPDVLMIRYSAAHRGAEEDVFPALPRGDKRPGICAYTATRWATLLDPKRTPTGEPVPRAEHCYRFCLSHPEVDMVLCGPANTQHVEEACTALAKGPLDEEELVWMRRVGDHVYGRSPVSAFVD